MEFRELVEQGVPYYHDERDLSFLLKNSAYLGENSKEEIEQAYQLAKKAHEGVFREGGSPYMSHPFTVASYAAYFQLSKEAILASLLHDVVEDTEVTLEEIEQRFGTKTASIVDGVTKLKFIEDKQNKVAYNTSKLFRSFLHLDAEVFLIKLLDRVHNMTTIHQKKRREKQIENAKETLDVFVPMARHLGCGAIRKVLEDLSFKCLSPLEYEEIQTLRKTLQASSLEETNEIEETLEKSLHRKGIQGKVQFLIKEAYGIYRKQQVGFHYSQIHDLLSMRVVVGTKEECYATLASIHEIIKPEQYRMKDYISLPKTNQYQSFHTTGYTEKGTRYQFRIRTDEMADLAERGIGVYSNRKDLSIQQALENNYQFYQDLKNIDKMYSNDISFYQALKEQILAHNIYIHLTDNTLELPQNSTVLDLICKLGKEELLYFSKAFQNGKMVSLGTPLKDQDTIQIYRREQAIIPSKALLDDCKTPLAKGLIDSFYVPQKVKTRNYCSRS